jgi:hypothetical protein
MDTKVFIINYTSQWHSIEHIHDTKVQILIVLLTTFLIKVETLGHLPGLMIASEQENIVLVLNFHCHQQDYYLHAERSTINVVTQK